MHFVRFCSLFVYRPLQNFANGVHGFLELSFLSDLHWTKGSDGGLVVAKQRALIIRFSLVLSRVASHSGLSPLCVAMPPKVIVFDTLSVASASSRLLPAPQNLAAIVTRVYKRLSTAWPMKTAGRHMSPILSKAYQAPVQSVYAMCSIRSSQWIAC